jgi:protein involved in plasmid replication-relaxation
MTTLARRILTGRDLEVLQALDRTPLTAGQMLTLSLTFAHPFGSERMVRERLQALGSAGWVRSGRYATTSQGAGQNYYHLGRTGYRILYGETAQPPTKRYFSPLSLARQHHTRCLADFIVHTIVATHATGVAFTDFYRENTLRLPVGAECLYPDCAFQLILPDGRAFYYLVEIDNHTEQIRSTKDADSWQRKARLYDDLQSTASNRFRVLVVTTRSGPRLKTILSLAAEHASNPQRSVLIGTPLAAYLAEPTPLSAPIFLDHHLRSISLLTGPGSWKQSTRHNRVAASEAPQSA